MQNIWFAAYCEKIQLLIRFDFQKSAWDTDIICRYRVSFHDLRDNLKIPISHFHKSLFVYEYACVKRGSKYKSQISTLKSNYGDNGELFELIKLNLNRTIYLYVYGQVYYQVSKIHHQNIEPICSLVSVRKRHSKIEKRGL